VRRQVVPGSATVALSYPSYVEGRLAGDGVYRKHIRNYTSITGLENNYLSDPSLTLFLTGGQLHLPKHSHRKFIPKQLGL